MADEYITRRGEKGSVNISDGVIAVITASAVSDTEGVAGFAHAGGGESAEFFGKKSVSKGVKIKFDGDDVIIDVLITVHFGANIMTVAEKVQEAVCASVESMTGIRPSVNAHVAGVVFDDRQSS